ncbi:uncharacterized protein LOC6573154 [Drosophila mojavensis]|uniref:Uncharacterized protein n=1 Tax=Drosophila mojavensis TaxID=7230 RepID=B4KBM9_DROMO|nr:uncharacterized protein LOC6573154 [Drosophila mojavensis]EDW14706.1 uncharacterized protein Dmoj_GI24402 [Drosophila mojavensis]
MSKVLLFISCLLAVGWAHGLPPAVQLGGAIVAAVEQDAEQQEEELAAAATVTEQRWLQSAEQQLERVLSGELSGQQLSQLLGNWSAEARGKHHKHKKLMKMLFPLVSAAVLAKFILLPLILKWLTALSASSFVMGKIALAAAGLLALKSMMSPTHERLEIVHASAPTIKSYHGDLSSSGSSWIPLRQHYIPLGVAKDSYRYDNKPFL